MPAAPFEQELPSQLLSQVNFEFEYSASQEEILVAEVMRTRLAQASLPLGEHGFSAQLPVRSDPWISNLWHRIANSSMGGPQIQSFGEHSPDLILTLLTRQSSSTLMEATALAMVNLAPQVCIGIDMPVPELLNAFSRVSSVRPSADESLLVQVVEDACRQDPHGQPMDIPLTSS